MESLRRWVAWVLILGLALAGGPGGAFAAPGSTGVVVYGGKRDQGGVAVDVARWRLGDSARVPWQAVARGDSAALAPGVPFVVGSSAVGRCGANPVSLEALRSSLAAVRQEVDGLLLPAARRDLGVVDAAIPCLGDVVEGRDLTTPQFLRGVLEFYDGRIDGATEAFRAALDSDPTLQWDDSYPPDVKEVFERARAGAAVAALAPAKVRVALSEGSQGFLDGKPLREGMASVAPGAHLFQVRRDDVVRTVRFEADAAREVGLYDGESAWARLTSGDGGAEATSLLAALAAAHGAGRACAWTGRARGPVACWDQGQAVAVVGASPSDPAAAVAAAASGAGRPAGGGSSVGRGVSAAVLIGGLVTAGVGAGMTGAGFSAASPIITNNPECIDDDPSNDGAGCEDLARDYSRAFYDLYRPGQAILVVGGAVAVGGLVGLIVSSVAGKDARAQVIPHVGPDGVGLGVTGRW
ncbi:hypothetical protein L6R50_01745 [Myxococcota bacterium]|nr:hypothetical protein [Myxococcota bacterium]